MHPAHLGPHGGGSESPPTQDDTKKPDKESGESPNQNEAQETPAATDPKMEVGLGESDNEDLPQGAAPPSDENAEDEEDDNAHSGSPPTKGGIFDCSKAYYVFGVNRFNGMLVRSVEVGAIKIEKYISAFMNICNHIWKI